MNKDKFEYQIDTIKSYPEYQLTSTTEAIKEDMRDKQFTLFLHLLMRSIHSSYFLFSERMRENPETIFGFPGFLYRSWLPDMIQEVKEKNGKMFIEIDSLDEGREVNLRLIFSPKQTVGMTKVFFDMSYKCSDLFFDELIELTYKLGLSFEVEIKDGKKISIQVRDLVKKERYEYSGILP